MKYIYVNNAEQKIVCICKKQDAEFDTNDNLTLHKVTDDFDLSKTIQDGEGSDIVLDGAIDYALLMQRLSGNYVQARVNEYPTVENQLDMLFHELRVNGSLSADGEWVSTIQAIKDAHSKAE